MSTQGVDPDALIQEAQSERNSLSADAQSAFEWFRDRVGEMVPRQEAIAGIASHLDCDEGWANVVLGDLVGDAVDPVQQIRTRDGRYVGIIDFEKFEDSGAYGFEQYDDLHGRAKRVVCAQCVREADTPAEVSHATAGDGSLPADADYGRLLNRVTSHYASAHDCAPESVEVGASLASGTTIDGSKAWHSGNDGQDSGLNADEVQGRDLASELDSHETADTDVHGVGEDTIASDADIADEIDAHTEDDIHDKNQPFADHDNDKHTETFAIEGETRVEDFPSDGETGARFEVDEDGNVVATTAAADVDNHEFGGTKHNASPTADINGKIEDGDLASGKTATITDSDSPYTTDGENLLLVDTTDGSVTVELASDDATEAQSVRIVDIAGNAGENEITVETEGDETLEPGGYSSATVSVDGAELALESDGSDWYTGRNAQYDTIEASDSITDPDGVEHTGELADSSDVSSIQSSSDVDHNETSNRTHNGDDLTPDSVDVSDSITDPSGTEHTGELADSSDVSSIQSSSDVDHDSTSGRTHDGDDLTPAKVEVNDYIGNATYASKDDVPDDLPEGTQVYVEGDGLYVEDGS